VGLITGCFDVVHVGHINLFQFAKKHVEVLIIGVENDTSVKLSKGKGRPINPVKSRLRLLSVLSPVDYVFPIESTYQFSLADKANSILEDVTRKIMPTAIITDQKSDRYIDAKRARAEKLGIGFITYKRNKSMLSSTSIIRKMEMAIS